MHPCTGTVALYRPYGPQGSRGIALLFHDNGTRRGWGVSVTPRPLFTPGKDPAPIVQEAGWAPGPVWTGAENLSPTGIQSPYCPACSQLLYRLCSWTIHNSNLQDATWNMLQHKIRYTLPFVTQHHDITPLINLQQHMVTPFIFTWWRIVLKCKKSVNSLLIPVLKHHTQKVYA